MFLGIDLGTTNVKALVTSDAGETLGEGSNPVRLFQLEQGGVEQDIDDIWAATVSAIRKATKAVNAAEIRAIGVSSQGGALQVYDKAKKPIGRVISWLDQRGRPYDRRLTEELGRDWFVERIGHRGAGLAVGQLMRLGQKPDSPHGGTQPTGNSLSSVGFFGDIIAGRLCGRAAQDGTSAALTLLYNPNLRDYDPELLQRIGIQAEQLPDVIVPRVAAGNLLPEVAQATGLPAGIPVSAAIHDQYAAALGTGAVHAGTIMIGAGTAWVLLAVSKERRAPVVENAFVCHHLAEKGEGRKEKEEGRGQRVWGQIVSLVNGGSALTWALELMGMAGRSYDEIERLLEAAPAGSEGVSFWPFLARPGGEGVAPDTKGRLSGLQLSHKPAHVVRAVVEGLAFELKRHLLFLERGGIPVQRLVIGGATAASRVTTQIIADVTGLPLACFGLGAGSVLGAAMLARGLVEAGRSLADLSQAMLPVSRVVQPGAEAEFYAGRFQQYAREVVGQ